MKTILLALVISLVATTAHAQFFYDDSYANHNDGYGYSIDSYGTTFTPGYSATYSFSHTYVFTDYGYGQTLSTYGFSYGGDPMPLYMPRSYQPLIRYRHPR